MHAASTSATSRWRPSAARAPCCSAGWSTSSAWPACWCRATPGNVSAFGLLTVDVRNDYVQTAVARHDDLDLARSWRRCSTTCSRQARGQRSTRRASRATDHRYVRSADLRYAGQAFEVRVPTARRSRRRRLRRPRWPTPSTTRTSSSTATRSATTPASRSSGSTCGSRASARSRGRTAREIGARDGDRSGRAPAYARCSSTPRRAGSTPRSTGGRTWPPATCWPGRPSSRSSARPCRCTRASPPASTGSATCWSGGGVVSTVDPCCWRSSRVRWRRSSSRWRPRSGAPRGRR